jgi:hypothetical protein
MLTCAHAKEKLPLGLMFVSRYCVFASSSESFTHSACAGEQAISVLIAIKPRIDSPPCMSADPARIL